MLLIIFTDEESCYTDNVKSTGRMSLLSSGEIDEIYDKYTVYPQYSSYSGNIPVEFKKRIAYSIFNSAKVIQQAWRTYRLRPKIWQNEFGIW